MVIWTEQTYTSTTPSHPVEKNKQNKTIKAKKQIEKKRKSTIM
jgi:hypothetical protein